MNDQPVPANPAEVSVQAMRFSPTIAAFAAALSAAQGEMHNPKKDKTAKVQMKNGGSYSFTYADLASVFDAVRYPLAKNGLAVLQAPSILYHPEFPPIITVQTRVIHSSGEWVENEVKMISEESRPQVVASAISYAKRYALQALLGVVAEEDDDGNAASGHERQEPARQQSQRQEPQHQQTTPPAQDEVVKAKAEHDVLVLSLQRKLGKDEATHQIAAIKKQNGDNWKKSLVQIRALNESIPETKP